MCSCMLSPSYHDNAYWQSQWHTTYPMSWVNSYSVLLLDDVFQSVSFLFLFSISRITAALRIRRVWILSAADKIGEYWLYSAMCVVHLAQQTSSKCWPKLSACKGCITATSKVSASIWLVLVLHCKVHVLWGVSFELDNSIMSTITNRWLINHWTILSILRAYFQYYMIQKFSTGP